METKIALIGTGGTIAGQGASDTDLTGYTAGVLGLDEILDSVPGTEPYVHIHILSLVILKVPILLSSIGWIYLS